MNENAFSAIQKVKNKFMVSMSQTRKDASQNILKSSTDVSESEALQMRQDLDFYLVNAGGNKAAHDKTRNKDNLLSKPTTTCSIIHDSKDETSQDNFKDGVLAKVASMLSTSDHSKADQKMNIKNKSNDNKLEISQTSTSKLFSKGIDISKLKLKINPFLKKNNTETNSDVTKDSKGKSVQSCSKIEQNCENDNQKMVLVK